MVLGGISDLHSFFGKTDLEARGCLVDTSILFAMTYPLDRNNEQAEKAFECLREASLSVFTNVNVKYEFLENHRRVFLADSICDFYDLYGNELPQIAAEKLKSFKTSHRKKVDADKSSRIEKEQQTILMSVLRPVRLNGRSAWETLCKDFLLPQLNPVWENAVEELRIKEIRTREEDKSPLLHASPDWEGVVQLMGTHGIASSDAMIINMFRASKIEVLITADIEMARCALAEEKGKKAVFVPDAEAERLLRENSH